MPFSRGLRTSQLFLSRALSGLLIVAQFTVAGIHASYSLAYRGVNVAASGDRLEHLRSLDTWWLIAFGATGLLLIGTWALGRWRQYAHALAGAVWVMYAGELWFATFAITPLVPLTWAASATLLAGIYAVVAGAHAEHSEPAGRKEDQL